MSPLGVGTKRANHLERFDTSKGSGGGRTLRAWASSVKGKYNPVKTRAACPWAGVNEFLWGASFERGHQV